MRDFHGIRFMQMKTHMFREFPEGYKYFKPKKCAWLAKLFWEGLRRLNALEPWWYEEPSYHFTHKDQAKLDKAIFKHISHLIESGEKIEDYAIICGSSTFQELTQLQVTRSGMSFPSGRFGFGHRDPRKGMEYHYSYEGIPVHVVPYMDGIAAIPRVILEKEENEPIQHKVSVKERAYMEPWERY